MSMLYDANQRIEKIRKKDVEFIVRKDGRPVSNAQINVNEETPILIWKQLFSSEFL